MKDYFLDRDLVTRPPVKRAAYSDRTAWIMAELSRLVYERLPSERTVAELIAEVRESVRRGDDDSILLAMLSRANVMTRNGDSVLEQTLGAVNFELLECFMSGGTEAILVRLNSSHNFEGMLVLIFRGTEPKVENILTNLKANLITAPEGGRIHKGFHDAFEQVHDQIDAALRKYEYADLPIYVTGHSLGGALAIVATSRLISDSIGACYTFGAPRVADDIFFQHIKTPVYRVVNAADGVPRVPFGYGFSFCLSLIRLIPISFMFELSEFCRRHLLGYTHCGSLVFINHVDNVSDENGINFSGLKVWHSPDFMWRASMVLKRLFGTRFKAAESDHMISEYCQKLLAHAQRRNLGLKKSPSAKALK